VNPIKKYDISIYGLEDRDFSYEFEGADAFFNSFGSEETGNFKARVKMNKSSTMLQLSFEIDANVNLICDRSLEPFTEELEIDGRYFFKFGEKNDPDYAEEMEVIEFGTQVINIAQHIYDFIALAIPSKRIHPDLRDDYDEDQDELVYTSGGDEEEEEEQKEIKPEEIDPRWAALMKLKGNN
jgi:uncharacterized metal-binding protein YceD (DUF177 family)